MPTRPTRSASSRFSALLAGSTLVAASVVLVPQVAMSAPGELTLNSAELQVSVGSAFPYVSRYTDRASGASLDGRTGALDAITVNGAVHKVTGHGEVDSPGVARYTLSLADQPGVTIDASLTVAGRATTFRIDKVTDTEAFRVGTIDIPGHDLVSVHSGQTGAATAFTRLDPNRTRTADVIGPVTPGTPADPAPVGASYGIVSTGALAAAVETNSVYDTPSGPTNGDDARLWHQSRKEQDGTTRVGVWSGQWTYRADTSSSTEEPPWATVVVTPEVNGDGVVDWQDGAIAFRDIAVNAPGAGQVASRVVTHIPFNFASHATHPFLRTLDDVKRIALATDGLGQRAVLKGYGSEGHDSAHPDYGGNYNSRAGGLADLNTLLAEGEKWNADFGVHVNATESYPEAKAFNEKLVDFDRPGWDWLDESWEIDQRRDNVSGDLAQRFRQLRDETHPNLDFLYIDVYRNHGYVADHMLGELRRQGWTVGTEWSDKLERSSVWSHWANDMDYGGETNKGLNSQIIRFIRNHQRDTWNEHPILGSSRIEEFEGWTGEVDWNAFYDNVWAHNLPTKFLQRHSIQRWDEHEITFSGGVRGSDAAGKRELFVRDAKVLDGDRYLIPWRDEANQQSKLYHYNPAGGRSEWTLPAEFSGARNLMVYELTDQGRKAVGSVPVDGGAVNLDARPRTPYVLYPESTRPRPVEEVRWGAGSSLVDPGFNGGDLAPWNPHGNATIERTDRGQRVATFGPGAASIEQRLGGLKAGTYSASVWVEVQPGQRRRTEISVQDGHNPVAVNHVDDTTAKNWVAADDKHGTYFQRMRVLFDVAADGAGPTLRVAAGEGGATVRLDDVRVVPAQRPAAEPGVVVSEDFEQVDQGWGPFVKGDAGGVVDPRTHLAEANGEYTKRGWRGKLVDDTLAGSWSLKAHEENTGLVYRTVPQTARFIPGHRYRIEFDHQNGQAGQYSWITGSDTGSTSTELHATPIAEQRGTARFVEEFTAGPDGETWVGLRKLASATTPSESDLVVDDFTIIDLGRV